MLKLNNETVSNPLAETNLNQNPTAKIIVPVIIISLSLISLISFWYFTPIKDPYVEEVLSYQGNIKRGEAIFQVNCAVCHGMNATGNVGPSLLAVPKHKSDVQIIKQVVSGKTPPMPKFQPSAEDMADLLSYLKQLP